MHRTAAKQRKTKTILSEKLRFQNIPQTKQKKSNQFLLTTIMKLSINSTIVLALCFGVSAISADMNLRGESRLLAAPSNRSLGKSGGKKSEKSGGRQLNANKSQAKRGRQLNANKSKAKRGRQLDKMQKEPGNGKAGKREKGGRE